MTMVMYTRKKGCRCVRFDYISGLMFVTDLSMVRGSAWTVSSMSTPAAEMADSTALLSSARHFTMPVLPSSIAAPCRGYPFHETVVFKEEEEEEEEEKDTRV